MLNSPVATLARAWNSGKCPFRFDGPLGECKEKIVSVVEGHNPNESQGVAAREAFIRVHTFGRGSAAVKKIARQTAER